MVDASLLGGRGRLGMASSNQHPGRRPSVIHVPHHPSHPWCPVVDVEKRTGFEHE